jgi:AraC-like DNA-binding protein
VRDRARAGSGDWRVESERAAWPVVTHRPHPLLHRILTHGYVGVTSKTPPHRLLIRASASVPLVVKVEDSAHRPAAFVHGVHDSFVRMDGDCARRYLQVSMAPLGAYRLLGRPVGELGGTVVDLQDVFGAAGRRVQETVREAPTWERRFAVLDAFLVRAADEGPHPSPEVAMAWQRLLASGGRLPIGRLADDVEWSHKHLITRFSQQVGLTPKTAARLVRFEQVLRRIGARRTARWDQLAADAGYADQAHLIRDFHAFAGVTPTGYLDRLRASA